MLVLCNGDYLLIGPAEFKDRHVSRAAESELWLLEKSLNQPPVRLGRRVFEGCAVRAIAPRISYCVTANQEPSIGQCAEVRVAKIDYDRPTPRLVDLWKLKLDGSGRRGRMTRMVERRPWWATNSNVSPDARRLAFMVNLPDDEYGYGRGLGLLDLQAWEKSPQARQWQVAAGGYGLPPDMR